MQELQDKINLLIKSMEVEITQIEKMCKKNDSNRKYLERKYDKLEILKTKQKSKRNRIEALKDAISSMDKSVRSLVLRDLGSAHHELMTRFLEEYASHGLLDLAVLQGKSHILKLIEKWEPLCETSNSLFEIIIWINLLQKNTPHHSTVKLPAVAEILSEFVIPPIARAIATTWQVCDPKPLVEILKSLETIVPNCLIKKLFESVLFKIQRTVIEWNPREEFSIHLWIEPWVAMLRVKIFTLYPKIRLKLAFVFKNWNILDQSMIIMIAPWKNIWGAIEWNEFCARSIVPVLQNSIYLRLTLNPANQNLDILDSVFAWHGILKNRLLVQVLVSAFFPQFHQILRYWILHNPNYYEIIDWFVGLKGLLPQDILDHDCIQHQLKHALETVDVAKTGIGLLPSFTSTTPELNQFKIDRQISVEKRRLLAVPESSDADLSFKKLLEHFAEMHEIDFVPKPFRHVDGLQAFGSISVILDVSRHMLKAYLNKHWVPISMEAALIEHRKKLNQTP
jgi:tuftelin-interacting protein 11